jgi:hypothetical protein
VGRGEANREGAAVTSSQHFATQLDARITAALATPVKPEPWDERIDEIGVPWWIAVLPRGAKVAAFEGIGIVLLECVDGIIHAGWTIADPKGPGATERREWINAAIRHVFGAHAIQIHAGAVMRARGAA